MIMMCLWVAIKSHRRPWKSILLTRDWKIYIKFQSPRSMNLNRSSLAISLTIKISKQCTKWTINNLNRLTCQTTSSTLKHLIWVIRARSFQISHLLLIKAPTVMSSRNSKLYRAESNLTNNLPRNLPPCLSSVLKSECKFQFLTAVRLQILPDLINKTVWLFKMASQNTLVLYDCKKFCGMCQIKMLKLPRQMSTWLKSSNQSLSLFLINIHWSSAAVHLQIKKTWFLMKVLSYKPRILLKKICWLLQESQLIYLILRL